MTTSAAARKAAERQRKKDKGLVRREIWIRPERAAELPGIERRLQVPK